MLSKEEQQTLAVYNRTGKTRRSTHFNLDFWRKEFVQFNKFLSSGKILDIGCGNGRDSAFFTPGAYEYVGIDLSTTMIDEARELFPGIDFRVMSMYQMDFPDNFFTGFWAANSLVHIPKSKVNGVLQEIKRVIKSGGVGFISLKKGEGECFLPADKKDSQRHFSLYQIDEFSKILEDNGFNILSCREDNRVYKPEVRGSSYILFFVRV